MGSGESQHADFPSLRNGLDYGAWAAGLATEANAQGCLQASLSREAGRWAGGKGLSPAYQRRGLPLLANANLCGLREADDRGLEGTGHGGRSLPSRALDGAAQHHGRERGGGLQGGRLLLALLDEGCGVRRQLSQGGQAPLGGNKHGVGGRRGSGPPPQTQRHPLRASQAQGGGCRA